MPARKIGYSRNATPARSEARQAAIGGLAGQVSPRGDDFGATIETATASLHSASDRASHAMKTVQIFGFKNSQSTRAAERFFKEPRVPVQFVDLKVKPMAPAEIGRFIDRFGLALVDTEGKHYANAGLKYMKMTEVELLARIERDPALLRLPFVRADKRLSTGRDEEAWKTMLD